MKSGTDKSELFRFGGICLEGEGVAGPSLCRSTSAIPFCPLSHSESGNSEHASGNAGFPARRAMESDPRELCSLNLPFVLGVSLPWLMFCFLSKTELKFFTVLM